MVAVVSNTGTPMMPTNEALARKLIKSGRAKVYKRKPVFTIMLLDKDFGYTQPIEYKQVNTPEGIAISVCTEDKELHSEYRILNQNEPLNIQKSKTKRQNRRKRRKNYQKKDPVKQKQKMEKSNLMPKSIEHRTEICTNTFKEYNDVLPITDNYVQVADYSPEKILEIKEGDLERFKGWWSEEELQRIMCNFREAAVKRDHKKCHLCGENGENRRLMVVHFNKPKNAGDMELELENTFLLCSDCLEKVKRGEKTIKPMRKDSRKLQFDAEIVKKTKERFEDIDVSGGLNFSFPADTVLNCKAMGLSFSDLDKAYAMGEFHPEERAKNVRVLKKKRRNNRELTREYDAKYIDKRTGKPMSGRSFKDKSLRGEKVQKGHTKVIERSSAIRSGDTVYVKGAKHIFDYMTNNGKSAKFTDGKTALLSKIDKVAHHNGWIELRD